MTTPPSSLRRRLIVIAGASALVISACGSDDSTPSESPSESAPPVASAEPEGAEALQWGYAEAEGWGELGDEFAACGTGTEQSPIDLTDPSGTALEDPVLSYGSTSASVTDDGATVQVNLAGGNTAMIAGNEYSLLQFHFHGPSEHALDGELRQLEVHLVHADDSGNLAVIGVMIDEGEAMAAMDPMLAAIPAPGEEVELDSDLDPMALLPDALQGFRYPGSLTTPPCSEGVTWTVLTEPVTWSGEQIEMLTSHFVEENNRPLQDLNDRDLQLDND